MEFFDRDDLLEMHGALLDCTGGAPGLRDAGLLDSALTAPVNRYIYEHAGLAVCAATYAFHITRNHPFIDGNKRLGAMSSQAFVELNGGSFHASNDEIVRVFLAIASGVLTRDEVEAVFAAWVTLPD